MSPVMVQEHGHPEEWGEDASGSPASEAAQAGASRSAEGLTAGSPAVAFFSRAFGRGAEGLASLWSLQWTLWNVVSK